ncbi:MAG: phosphate regulon sensor histidine kinase PhoR [Gammaproteobacteria bacterium]|nr:phosphate regulon sensor histidine kinase PhoR [Gammaproteobacteria bacterium]
MIEYWIVERWRIVVALFFALLFGLLTGLWSLGLGVASALLLAWHFYQAKRLSRWLESGADIDRVPDFSGVWEQLARYVFRIQRRHQQRKQHLRQVLQRFQATAAALPDATVLLRNNLEIEWANNTAEQLLGIRTPQDFGQRIDNLIRDPAFHEYITGPDTEETLNLLAPVDERMTLNIRVIRFADDSRLFTARDVSTLMRAQTMRKDFVANVSHELRTPLTVMTGYLETLADDESFDEEQRHILRSVRQQGLRLQHIVHDLLELSRLENDGRAAPEQRVHVPSILASLREEALHLTANTGHKLTWDVDESLCLLGADTELRSLLSNLVYNAIRHTPADTAVQVHWHLHGEQGAIFEVIDQGPGIPIEHIPRLTERFYRVDAGRARDKGGSGLGLSIVKHVVARHQATFDIHSTAGVGSQFRVVFPAHRVVVQPR